MRRSIFTSAVLLTVAALTVAAAPASGAVAGSAAAPDAQFVDRLFAQLTRELELAHNAVATAQLPALRSFAQVLIAEREDQLIDLAEIRNRLAGRADAVPETRTARSPAGQTAVATQTAGSADRRMIDEFIRQHREVIRTAHAQAASGKDAELRAFARRLTYSSSAELPELQGMR